MAEIVAVLAGAVGEYEPVKKATERCSFNSLLF
jgi:hypothetical protein